MFPQLFPRPDRASCALGRLAAWAALLLAASLLPGAIHAAPLRMDVFLGYDGTVPYASWFPAVFEIENSGPGFEATVEVTPSQVAGGARRSLRVELPTGTTKRVVLPVYNGASQFGSWDITLRDAQGRVRAKLDAQRPARWQEPQVPLAGALTRLVPGLPEVPSRRGQQAPRVARLLPSLFPDHPITLEGLATLYLSSERAIELRPEQAAALEAWLRAGGHLVVGLEQPGHLAGAGAWLERLLPAGVNGLGRARSGAALHQWVVAAQRLDGTNGDRPPVGLPRDAGFEAAELQVARLQLRDGRVAAGTAAEPLMVTAPRGHGQITLLAFTPELEPFRGWSNAPYFWAKLTDLPPELLQEKGLPYNQVSRSLDGVLGALIDSVQVRKLPIGWLLLLLLAYLAVIGPLDKYLLARLRRPMLTWITFPCYVLFFSLLIYFIGYRLRAGDREWNELQVVDVIPRGGTSDWRGWTYASIYSPVNARYRVASPAPVASLRGESSGRFQGAGRELARASVRQVRQGAEAELNVPVWTSQLLVGDWRLQGPVPCTLRLARGVNGETVTVSNHLAVALAGVRLVRGDSIYDLGRLLPGEARSGVLADLPRQRLASFLERHAEPFAAAVDARQRSFGNDEASRLRDGTNAVMAASFASSLRTAGEPWERFRGPPGFDLGPLLARGDSVLLAFAPDHAPTAALNQFPVRRGSRHTLYRVAMPALPQP
ncbi:MAG: hypothetical protein RJA22_183 [Verrucomicrobiota bacterium]|jgi:hypothetical protein